MCGSRVFSFSDLSSTRLDLVSTFTIYSVKFLSLGASQKTSITLEARFVATTLKIIDEGEKPSYLTLSPGRDKMLSFEGLRMNGVLTGKVRQSRPSG
jgi:hypothetical protein